MTFFKSKYITLLTLFILILVIPSSGFCMGKKVEENDEYYYKMGLDLFNEGYYQLMPQGKNEEGKQKLDQAISALQVAVSMNDRSIESHFLLARIYVILNKYPDAAAEYNKVIELDPGNINVYLYLASTYVQMKKYDAAFEVLNYAKTLTSDKQAVERIETLVQSIKENE